MTASAPVAATFSAPNCLPAFKTLRGWRPSLGWLLVWLLALLLSGCAAPRMPATERDQNTAFWSGRMAVQVFNEPPESMSASFQLQGTAQKGNMLLLSPIGTTLARLEWSPDWAKLTQGAKAIESHNLPSLAHRLTGTELPIAALFDWLAGRTAEVPGWQTDLSQHAQGRLSAERLSPTPRTVLRIVFDR